MTVRVHVPSHLFDYTAQRGTLSAQGGTVRAVLADLERRFPGIRFRIVDEQERLRRHVRLYVNGAETSALGKRLAPGDELHVVAALSGG